MSAVYPTLPKLAVRDGYDEDDLTDIDDEVFIRDGKNGSLKIDDDVGVKRPLMAPRRKCKKSCSFERHKFPYRALWLPLCYGLSALIVLIILIILCIFTANIFPMPLTVLRNWLSHESKKQLNDTSIAPCTSLSTKLLWSRTLPKFTSESPLRSIDVNGDGIEDIIFGFSTGVDTVDPPEHICSLNFENQVPCLGGVLALNGKNGETLWIHWTIQAIVSVDCGVDLTNDKTKDCLISSDHGILHAISGHDGSSIWEMQRLTITDEPKVLDIYNAKFVADIDGDGIGDVIASHSVQFYNIRSSEILMLSGASGNVIHSTTLPETEQLILAPQALVHPDGENIFVLVTNSQKQSGGLYVVPQVNLMYGDLKLRKLEHDTGKGSILPPILVDITSDEVEDIIATMFNSSIIAYDGLTFEPLWNYTIPNSEIISVPIPGYYNDDDVPDFMVKHQIGSGFPIYYYTIATVIDGKTGKSLLEKPIGDSLSRGMSGLSVTVDDFGNDWFLHWSVNCLNFEGVKQKYQFLQGENLMSELQADLCKLRFNSTLVTNLFALSQHVGPPGTSLYYSEDYRAVEFNKTVDSKTSSLGNAPFVSARSPKIEKSQVKDSSVKSKGEDVPINPDTYNSGTNHAKYSEYKDQKRLSMSDFGNERLPSASNFNAEYSWKQGNKWPSERIGTEKDYEISYDNGNNAGEGDDQNIDYPQVEEVREQRSDTEDNSFITSLSSNNTTNLENTKVLNNSIRRKRNGNFSLESLNVTHSGDTNYNTFSIKVDRNENVTVTFTGKDGSPIKEIYDPSNSTADLEYNGTLETLKKNHTAVNSSDELDTMIKSAEKYVHVYPSPIEDTDDESIEKIFKRESLKNQNKMENGRKELRKERRKREAENQSGKDVRVEGIQQQPPAGIILPTISESKDRTCVDLVFTTSWLPPSDISVILLPEDLECVYRKKALAPKKFQYRDNDEIVKDCLSERGVNYKLYQESIDRENYKVSLGQMTVYRMKLECVCPEDMLPNQSCKNISSHQSWPQYLGALGNGYFRPARKPKV